MRICQLEIENFRGIRSGKVILPEHGVLFGPNNAGKSTIIDAIALLFERDRITRQLSDWDFCGGLPRPESRITIIGTITGFGTGPEDEPEKFPRWFHADAARPVWWNPETKSIAVDLERPAGTQLAVQIALSIHFDDEICEFKTARFFYNGPCDPFTDDVNPVPSDRLVELGVFVLPGNRQWDKLLTFGSSSFLKALKNAGAIPGKMIEDLKQELRNPVAKIEEAQNFQPILDRAERELRTFLMIAGSSSLVYRPTMLDSISVLQSLTPHVLAHDGTLLPFIRNGAGTVSLQAFLIVLAFAEHRRAAGKNFILAAEEPELHLHPSLHRRLANRIRNISAQSVITTHSPLIAGSFQPASAIYVRNNTGQLQAECVESPNLSTLSNSVGRLYRTHREHLYEALMGAVLLVPEGDTDWRWIRLLQTVVETATDANKTVDFPPITVVPTGDGAVAKTISELARFRTDILPLVDGDAPGDSYIAELESLNPRPQRAAQFTRGAAIESLVAYVAEPLLDNPGPILSGLLPDPTKRSAKHLRRVLGDRKKDFDLAEQLVWEIADIPASVQRAVEFFYDLTAISAGDPPPSGRWKMETRPSGLQLFVAEHISVG